MGSKVSRNDFEWVYTDEPHATRRKQILEKYPEVKKLMGPNPWLTRLVPVLVFLQLISMYLVMDASWLTVILLAYCFGGTINHSLSLAIHEIAHNLAFGHSWPMANRIFGFFSNLPLGVPMSISFKKYHLEHHRFQGDVCRDVDIPSKLECYLFQHTLTKIIWLFLQPYFYAFRPLFVYPKPLIFLEVTNIAIQFSFDCFVLAVCGTKSMVYLLGGTFLAMGIHPMSGHFISEHYMFVKGFETYSYYGPLNILAWNVGYHNEHHDFPYIAGCRLPDWFTTSIISSLNAFWNFVSAGFSALYMSICKQAACCNRMVASYQIRKIAPEFYSDLPCHTSWVKVLWDFVFCSEIGLYSRVRRRAAVKHNMLDVIQHAE